MHKLIQIGRLADLAEEARTRMFELRAKVFHKRLGWDVAIQDNMEMDSYDILNPYCMLVYHPSGSICGCWRILPTLGPYMLKNTFPGLLHGHAPPENADIWELSRFAIKSDGRRSFGFTELVLDAMREVVIFADQMGIHRYVTVTTLPIERLLIRTGITIRRFGPPLRIGIVDAIALEIDLGEQTHFALYGHHTYFA